MIMKDCAICHGSGYAIKTEGGLQYDYNRICPHCGGTGKVRDYEAEERARLRDQAEAERLRKARSGSSNQASKPKPPNSPPSSGNSSAKGWIILCGIIFAIIVMGGGPDKNNKTPSDAPAIVNPQPTSPPIANPQPTSPSITSDLPPIVESQPEDWETISKEVVLLFTNGQYFEATLVGIKALALAEKTFGPKHPNTATSLYNLGILHAHQRDVDKAELLFRRAIAIQEKHNSWSEPMTLYLDSLAALYYSQERYDEAQPLYLRSLEIMENRWGSKHPQLVTILNNLADLYRVTNLINRAEYYEQRVIDITQSQG